MNDPTSHNAFAVQVAEILLEIKAISFRPHDPFILTSGLPSPVYVDCRKIIAFPRARSAIVQMMVALICERVGFETIRNVAGGESAGIPFGAWVADEMNLPMSYIRKKPKGHGKRSRIEGLIKENERVLLVEDLATNGGSKISFVQAIRDAGGICHDAIVVFYYDIFADAIAELETQSITLHYLTNWNAIMQSQKIRTILNPEAIHSVNSFLSNPREWTP